MVLLCLLAIRNTSMLHTCKCYPEKPQKWYFKFFRKICEFNMYFLLCNYFTQLITEIRFLSCYIMLLIYLQKKKMLKSNGVEKKC